MVGSDAMATRADRLVAAACAAAIASFGTHVVRARAQDAGAAKPGAAKPGVARERAAIPADRAVVAGRVVEAVSGRPVPDADVRAQSADGTVTATSDADGSFELTVAPGRHTVAAGAAGFVESFFGQDSTRAGDFGAQVVATGGRLTRGIDIKLQMAGVVGGRVLDDKGTGIPSIEVELVRESRALGAVQAGAVSFALTEDDGSYRLRNVPPGDYFVRAYKGRTTAPIAPPAPIDPPAPRQATGAAATSSDANAPRAYVPTFYPGVRDRTEASPLRIFAGQELLGVDFPLAATRQFVVRGRLVDSGGASLATLVVILNFIGATGGGALQASVDGKGQFQFANVASGDYFLSVREAPRGTGPPPPGAGMQWLSASHPLAVDGDITDLELLAVPPARVGGRVLRDPESTRALDTSAVRVGLARVAEGGGLNIGGFSTNVIRGVLPEIPAPLGPTYLEVQAPDGWMVKSIRVNGASADDGPIDLQSARYDVEVVMTDRVSRVLGTVQDRSGAPLANHAVLIFPPDPNRWFPISRFILQGRTDNAGRFQLDAVPPGVYEAVSVPSLPVMATSAAVRRALLQALEPQAETIRVGEGQHLSLSLRSSPLPPDVQPAR